MTEAEMIVSSGVAADATLALVLGVVLVVSAALVGYFLLQIQDR
jgi:hypothetical protein